MSGWYILTLCAIAVTVCYVVWNYLRIKKMPEGTKEMAEMAGLIYYTDAATFADYQSMETDVYEKQAEYNIDHHDPSCMKDPVPVGFFAGEGTRVGDSGIYDYLKDEDKFQGFEKEAAFGILQNTERYDNALTGISYLAGK